MPLTSAYWPVPLVLVVQSVVVTLAPSTFDSGGRLIRLGAVSELIGS